MNSKYSIRNKQRYRGRGVSFEILNTTGFVCLNYNFSFTYILREINDDFFRVSKSSKFIASEITLDFT